MKLENKLIIPFAVFFISLILISLVFFDFMRITDSNFNNVLNVDSRFNEFSPALIQLATVRENIFHSYMRTGNEVFIERYTATANSMGDIYNNLLEDNTNSDLQKNYEKQRSVINDLISYETQIINGALAYSFVNSSEYVGLAVEYDDLLKIPAIRYQQYAKKDLLSSLQKANIYALVIFILIALSAVLLVGEFLVVKKDVINPISRITQGLESIRSKKFDTHLGTKDDSEMGQLMRELDATASQLSSHLLEKDMALKDRESMARLATEMIRSSQSSEKKGSDIQTHDGQGKDGLESKRELKEKDDMIKLALLAIKQNKEIKAKKNPEKRSKPNNKKKKNIKK